MKLYEFRCVLLSVTITSVFLSIFVYGIIWMNNQFTVDDRFLSMRKEFIQKQFDFENTMTTNFAKKKEIMKSCFIQKKKKR